MELQCYNKGCLQKYKEEDDNENSCTYHPGIPVFHDAMKGWSCCKKRSTNFTDFLNMPGCTTGKHNPIKPPEPEKPVVEPLKHGEEIRGPPPPRALVKMERPPDDIPYEILRVKVSNSLKTLLARLQNQQEEEIKNKQDDENNDDKEGDERGEDGDDVPLGTNCKNNTCKAIYIGPEINFVKCQYHPGVAIFHDGYKFWSCCQRRTSDFNEFQRQEGCTSGDHVWKKVVLKTQTCRYDWHQTGSMIVVTFYAKTCVPVSSVIKANRTNMSVKLTFDNGKTEFLKDIKLHGVIDPAKSCVEMLDTKVEVKLKKDGPVSWPDLHFKEIAE